MEFKQNEEKVFEYMERQGLDAFMVSDPVNVRYVTGFSASDGAQRLLFTKGKKIFFITDLRYSEASEAECPECETVIWRLPGKTMSDTVERLLGEQGCDNVAFEEETFSYNEYNVFSRTVKADKVPVQGVIAEMRMVKSPEEIACQRAACQISCRALERLMDDIRVGMTEKELAALLSLYMVQDGADTQPEGDILISGPKTSLLHGVPDERAIQYGDFVLMDFGCEVHGYKSDMTRTVVVGKATEEQKTVYGLVQQMMEACNRITKAGVTGREILLESLKPLEGTPYKGYEYNNIGHGIGLFVHEQPFDSITDELPFPVNNVRTIEPGLYIPGWGGVRIEDTIRITEDGFENFIDFTHDLIEL